MTGSAQLLASIDLCDFGSALLQIILKKILLCIAR
jgi:hypothetical protein